MNRVFRKKNIFFLPFLIFIILPNVFPSYCCGKSSTDYRIEDNEDLTNTLIKVRDRFLSKRPYFDMLDVVVMLPSTDPKTFLRGKYGEGDSLTYPASMIKYIYFLSAMNWCVENGKKYDCLDSHFRPLIMNDSNWECGVVVDIETESQNLPNLTSTSDPRWKNWLYKRNYTQRFLQKFDLLQNQVLLTKTYPTNSKLDGAELLMWSTYGRNMMNPCCSGMMMFDTIYEGSILPPRSANYAKFLLTKEKDLSPIGHGLPASTLIIEKDGGMFPVNCDTAYVLLPNGKYLFLSFFSNCLKSKKVSDYGLISYFVMMLISELGYTKDLPPQIFINTSETEESGKIVPIGKWYKNEVVDMIGSYFYLSDGIGTIEVYPNIPEDGKYQISIFIPTVDIPSNKTKIVVYSENTKNGKKMEEIVYMDQRVRSTYYSIGSFNLIKGNEKVLEIHSDGTQNVAVNSFLFSKYP